MTTSRIVRGTKGRIFLYVCAILIVTGIIACYNNTRIELDNVQKSNELCHQQQENLSTQLQVISDYKQRLEKSLKAEKVEHQHAISDLDSRVNEEKLRNEKSANEATLRFNSLQQHYNLLKTQDDDFKEECSKKQREQLDEINNLQSKLKEVQGQLKQSEREKEKSLGHLKSEIEQLEGEKVNLQKQIKGNVDKEEIIQLQKEIQELKANCQGPLKDFESIQAPQQNLSEVHTANANQKLLAQSEYKMESKNENNVADLPSNVGDEVNNINQDQLDAPKAEKSVDIVGNDQNVLPLPNNNKVDVKSSTPNSKIKGSSKAAFDIRPLKVPTVTPETTKIQLHVPNKKLPDGVVPVQDHQNLETKIEKSEGSDKETKNNEIKDKLNELQEKENGANEIFDLPVNEDTNLNGPAKHVEVHKFQKQHINDLGVGGDKDKMYDGGDYDKFAQNDPNLEENEEDDDADDYGNHNHLHKEPAVRN